MLRRYTIILNLFLIVAAIFLAERVYTIWTSEASEDLVSLGVQEAQAHSTLRTSTRARLIPRKLFDAIPAKDLFRPERTEWIPPQEGKETTTEGATPATPAKKIRVYGIVIADDFKQAWLLEEGNKRENPKSVSEGDALDDGWKVSAIEPDNVTLLRGTETVTYQLVEVGNPKTRAAPRSIAPTTSTPPNSRAAPPKPRPRRPTIRPRPASNRTR